VLSSIINDVFGRVVQAEPCTVRAVLESVMVRRLVRTCVDFTCVL